MDCLTPRAHVRTAEHIKKTLEARGYAVFFVPEVPTIIMGGGAQYPGKPGSSLRLNSTPGSSSRSGV